MSRNPRPDYFNAHKVLREVFLRISCNGSRATVTVAQVQTADFRSVETVAACKS